MTEERSLAAEPAVLVRRSTSRGTWLRRHPGTAMVIALLIVVAGNRVVSHVKDSWARRPLETVERAAATTGDRVGVISPALEDRWSSHAGPKEATLLKYVLAGNRFLEPVFFALVDEASPMGHTDRCYYVALQPGPTFDAARVTGVGQICYLDPYRSPQSVRFTSLIRH